MSLALRAVAIIALAAVAGVGAGLLIHALSDGGGSSTTDLSGRLMGQATWPRGDRPAPDFTLVDQNGQPTALSTADGQPALITFLDTRCLRSCPREGRSLAISLKLLPASARPAVIVVSLEPGAAPESAVRQAARRLGIDVAPSWHWLFGSRGELAPVWRSYGVAKAGHRARPVAYLIDEMGYERAGFLYPFPPNWLLNDIQVIRSEN